MALWGTSACTVGLRSHAPDFFFKAEDGIRDLTVTVVQTCALPIWYRVHRLSRRQIHDNRCTRYLVPVDLVAQRGPPSVGGPHDRARAHGRLRSRSCTKPPAPPPPPSAATAGGGNGSPPPHPPARRGRP